MPRNWEFVIDFQEGGPLPPFLQIARALVGEIQRGRLRPGVRLPGSRRMAATLGVHRNTVLAALAELISEGWIETAPGRGTFVTRAIPERRGRAFSKKLGVRAHMPNRVAFSLPDAPVASRRPLLPRGTLDLSNAAPDVRLIPARAIGRAYRRVLSLRAAEVLPYGDPDGHPALRTALASMLASTRGLSVTAQDVLITRGSQMALALAARTLIRPGDCVAVEHLGHRPAWEAFRAAGATLVPVPVDQHGVDVVALQTLARQTKLRAVYVTPHHQYPTTVTLKAARRLALLEFARAEQIAIIEDDYDHEFHYDGRPVLPLASADRYGVVIYIGTLSKILAPGLRIGYLVAPPAVLRGASAIRSLIDSQGDLATEAAVAMLIDDGELQRHIARVRRVYDTRRAVLANCLERTFGEELGFAVPAGGMAFWVHVRSGLDVDAWARRSLERGVSWYSGRRYAFNGQSIPFARLCFAWLNNRELVEAVKRMDAARSLR